MIAFSHDLPEPEDTTPCSVLIAGPKILTQQAIRNTPRHDASSGDPEPDVVTGQLELAMLQRALSDCGLI